MADAPSKRLRGRPRLAPEGAPSVDVHFRLTAKEDDRTYQQAAAERLTIADVIRKALDAQLKRS